jgi:hypothetical protein
VRRIRLLIIAIASFFGTIIGEGLVRRAIALLMCGVFSFNSTACYSYFWNTGEQANAEIPRARQQNQSPNEREFSETNKPEVNKPSLFEQLPKTDANTRFNSAEEEKNLTDSGLQETLKFNKQVDQLFRNGLQSGKTMIQMVAEIKTILRNNSQIVNQKTIKNTIDDGLKWQTNSGFNVVL